MTERAVHVAGADDEPLLPVQRLALRRHTIAGRLTREEMAVAAHLPAYPEGVERPVTRGDCEGGERPCPWVSCSRHLYLDVNVETGAIKFNHPGLEPWELEETCSLDVADRGGVTLEEVARHMRLTRERIRQVELMATKKLRQRTDNDNNPERATRP